MSNEFSTPLLPVKAKDVSRLSDGAVAWLKVWSAIVGFVLGAISPIAVGFSVKAMYFRLADPNNLSNGLTPSQYAAWIPFVILASLVVTLSVFSIWFALLRCLTKKANNGLVEAVILLSSPIMFSGLVCSFCHIMEFPAIWTGTVFGVSTVFCIIYIAVVLKRGGQSESSQSKAEEVKKTKRACVVKAQECSIVLV